MTFPDTVRKVSSKYALRSHGFVLTYRIRVVVMRCRLANPRLSILGLFLLARKVVSGRRRHGGVLNAIRAIFAGMLTYL